MAVSIEYEEETSNIDEYLYYAQLISQAFTKALDQQECNVKIVIGLAEEIESQKEKASQKAEDWVNEQKESLFTMLKESFMEWLDNALNLEQFTQ